MICYRDKTFCTLSDCSRFETCERAYTDRVREDAAKWWGSDDATVAISDHIRECYEPAKINAKKC